MKHPFINSEKQAFDLRQIKIWGPGLEPQNIVMPARYFFIDATNVHFNRLADYLSIVVDGTTVQKRPCRIWTNILDRKDGLVIVRYKIYEQCTYLKIIVHFDGNLVGNSPYIINENVSPECNCPRQNITEFIKKWHCGKVPRQINSDFLVFKTIDWNHIRKRIIDNFDKPHSISLCHYVVKQNSIFRKCYGKYVGFNMFSDAILLSLAKKVNLPDLEFFVNLGDWPLSLKSSSDIYPIFSWCGSDDSYDIVMPTYQLTEASLENMGRVMLDMLSVQGNVEDVWEQRQPRLFWRGRDSNRYRLDLIKLSKRYPNLFNVSLTNFFFHKEEEHIYGPKSDHVSFFDFFRFKYQIAIDGTVAPYRMPFLFGGGSLIFKPHSKYYEHFYKDLEPNYHYVPLNEDLSDLLEKLHWAQENDSKAKEIASNGQKFANKHLLPQHIFCYHIHLLNELRKKITSKVDILEGMEYVEQKSDAQCDCSMESRKKDEL
ncbi:protein O-glucosyltransferase 2-like isoform X2 [Cylas formicarius]|nr:protein O-glucosyltransferase 2-like isoform X2 [Cylas formicarius]